VGLIGIKRGVGKNETRISKIETNSKSKIQTLDRKMETSRREFFIQKIAAMAKGRKSPGKVSCREGLVIPGGGISESDAFHGDGSGRRSARRKGQVPAGSRKVSLP
jgi:hypothetical protein